MVVTPTSGGSLPAWEGARVGWLTASLRSSPEYAGMGRAGASPYRASSGSVLGASSLDNTMRGGKLPIAVRGVATASSFLGWERHAGNKSWKSNISHS